MVKLMLADDEAVITTQLERRLLTMGYDVVGTASSGEESIELARELKPALILMDIVMPGRLDGIDAAEIIKNELDIPIIFLTAYTDDKFIMRAKGVEPFGYIVKPFKEKEIKATIEIALYKKCIEQHQEQAMKKIRKLSEIVEQNPCMIVVTNLKGDIVYVNPKFTQFTGYTSKEVIGENMRFLKSGEIPSEVYKELWDTVTSGNEWKGEFCNKKKNGEQYWELAIITPIRSTKGIISHYFAVKIEISTYKQTEEQIKSSLQEKEILLKETHHRVKNNMNTVVSLLRLQSHNIKDKKVLNILKEGRHRVKAISLVHEQLSKSEDLAMFGYSEYLKHLTNNLLLSYGLNTDVISIKIDADDIFLEANKVTPCSLIISELVSNSLKYAFPDIIADVTDKPSGKEICISICLDNDKYTMIVSDNGVGFPEDIDFQKTETLGLELVRILVAQLEGTIELDRSKGTEFKITFAA